MTRAFSRSIRPLLLAFLACGLSACVFGRTAGAPPPQWLTHEVRRILENDRPSPAFYRDRSRLEQMGAELDPVLVALINNPDVDQRVRANALLLLADRGTAPAVPVLRRTLLAAEEEMLRAHAVLGLQKLASDSPAAAEAIRSAIGDPSKQVRMSVLQALDVEDVRLIRSLLRREEDRQVRAVARELVALAESRGAPLAPLPDGTYRTTAAEDEPQIVFQPAWSDRVAGVSVGALWVELPGVRLIPLAQNVEMVAGVIPAFFSQDRTAVVFEAEREIRVRDLRSGETRLLGPGVAPRVIPFTDRFIYLEERPLSRRETPGSGGTELIYEVLRTGYVDTRRERLGWIRAVARPDRFGNASPVRWMVVGETPAGFVLRGEMMSMILLPNPFQGPRRVPRGR